jgi:DNA-binding transcriptional regulator LsrR (DeoR family)
MARNRRDDEVILRIARMRYDQRLPQNEIARLLGVSESTVSRALKAAMDLGFVEIQITPYGLRDFELERRLERAYGLVGAIVVQPRASDADLFGLIGRAVASALEEHVTGHSIIGVSDGDTVASVAASVRRVKASEVDVVSLIGGVGAPQIPSHSSEVCRILGAGLGGRAWQLPVPAIVEDASAASALREISAVKTVFDLMRRMTIALVGVGTISPRATVFRHGVIDPAYIDVIAAKGAIGTICGRFFGRDGQTISTEFDERTLSVTLEGIRAAKLRIGVGFGEGKVEALRGAARGGILNMLGVDAETARALLS